MLTRWVLSQGTEAELLEPADLRGTLFKELNEMADKYKSQPFHPSKTPTSQVIKNASG